MYRNLPKSPSPLQHPAPQHPIQDFESATQQPKTPTPEMHYRYNQPVMQQTTHQIYDPTAYTPAPPPQQHVPQSHQSNLYTQFGLNDPAAQMGIQFAGSAMAQGSAYVEKNVGILIINLSNKN